VSLEKKKKINIAVQCGRYGLNTAGRLPLQAMGLLFSNDKLADSIAQTY